MNKNYLTPFLAIVVILAGTFILLNPQQPKPTGLGILYFQAPSPQAYWKLDENSGTTATDSAGASNGTLNGNAGWVAGKFGNAASFDGNNSYINVGNGRFNIANDFSIAFWIYIKGSTGTYQTIITRGQNTSPFLVQLEKSLRIRFGVITNSLGASYVTASPILAQNLWTHVVLTFKSSERIIYVNGFQIYSDALPGTLNWVSDNEPTIIGMSPGTTYSYPLNANLDDFKIYNTALTDAQVLELYTFTPPQDLCTGVTCNDSNKCTEDSCNQATGQCSFANKTDGTTCIGGTCQNGTCIANPPPACVEDWQCTEWSSCSNNVQSRTCTDLNNCGTTTNKPAETQACTSNIPTILCGNGTIDTGENCTTCPTDAACDSGQNCCDGNCQTNSCTQTPPTTPPGVSGGNGSLYFLIIVFIIMLALSTATSLHLLKGTKFWQLKVIAFSTAMAFAPIIASKLFELPATIIVVIVQIWLLFKIHKN